VTTLEPHLGEIFSALCALFWAVAVLFFRKSGESVPPVALNVFKCSLAFVLFVLTAILFRVPLVPEENTARDCLVLLGSGAVGIGVADSLFFASLNRLGAGGSAIVSCVYSPFVVLWAAVYLGEPLRPLLLLGMGLMVSAIVIATWERSPTLDPRDRREARAGVLLGLASMFLMAAGIVIAKPVLNVSSVWWATPVRLLGGLLVLGVHALAPRHRGDVLRAFLPGRQWLFTVPSAVLGSYVALVIWIAGMKLARAGVAGVLNQLSTLLVPLLAAIFLREKLTARKAAAVVLGFCGAVLAAL
jgi:drug/metabolite transporter (DMT)-like permease